MMAYLNEVTYNKTSVKCGQPFGSTEGEKLVVDGMQAYLWGDVGHGIIRNGY